MLSTPTTRCDCAFCRMGCPNQCSGPNAAENIERWKREYTKASAEFVFVVATGSMPSEDARDRFINRVREASRKYAAIPTASIECDVCGFPVDELYTRYDGQRCCVLCLKGEKR